MGLTSENEHECDHHATAKIDCLVRQDFIGMLNAFPIRCCAIWVFMLSDSEWRAILERQVSGKILPQTADSESGATDKIFGASI